MMNMSIECHVKNCKYNHQMERYCTLECIHIVRHKEHECNITDCANFEPR